MSPIYLISSFFNLSRTFLKLPEDLTTPELIIKNGHKVETHKITTNDGYILTTYRIPHTEPKKPILLHHGNLCTSDVFLIGDKTQSLALILANETYDVWLMNARGTRYSLQHTRLEHTDPTYWDFTTHEIGINDISANIDYILNKTGQNQLFYVGYSQGTMTFYALLTTKPEYNEKIRAHISLAPVAFFEFLGPKLNRILVDYCDQIAAVFELLGIYEVLPYNPLQSLMVQAFMTTHPGISRQLVEWHLGSTTEFNLEAILTMAGQIPAGTCKKLLIHFAQLTKMKEFQQYDYGEEGNLKVYNSRRPPIYNLSAITSPGYFFYSEYDTFTNYKDVERLYNTINSPKLKKFLIDDGKFNHLDFLLGKRAPKLIFTKIVALLSHH